MARSEYNANNELRNTKANTPRAQHITTRPMRSFTVGQFLRVVAVLLVVAYLVGEFL